MQVQYEICRALLYETFTNTAEESLISTIERYTPEPFLNVSVSEISRSSDGRLSEPE